MIIGDQKLFKDSTKHRRKYSIKNGTFVTWNGQLINTIEEKLYLKLKKSDNLKYFPIKNYGKL